MKTHSSLETAIKVCMTINCIVCIIILVNVAQYLIIPKMIRAFIDLFITIILMIVIFRKLDYGEHINIVLKICVFILVSPLAGIFLFLHHDEDFKKNYYEKYGSKGATYLDGIECIVDKHSEDENQ